MILNRSLKSQNVFKGFKWIIVVLLYAITVLMVTKISESPLL